MTPSMAGMGTGIENKFMKQLQNILKKLKMSNNMPHNL